jgi:O-methyltransferase
MKKLVKHFLGKFGLSLNRIQEYQFPTELSEYEVDILKTVKPITMTSFARLSALAIAVKYINQKNIEGDIVECGVWAGGSIAAAIKIDQQFNSKRKFWLYDTFDGMTPPSVMDSQDAHKGFAETKIEGGNSTWCSISENVVRQNLENLKIPLSDCVFIAGDVMKTLKYSKPQSIALLRLDTDWYESTKIELEELFPLLKDGGILIIDDYGYWEGARAAVDEYFSRNSLKYLVVPIDHTGRICLKI